MHRVLAEQLPYIRIAASMLYVEKRSDDRKVSPMMIATGRAKCLVCMKEGSVQDFRVQ